MMRARGFRTAGALALCVGASLLAAPASATFPAASNGPIVFVKTPPHQAGTALSVASSSGRVSAITSYGEGYEHPAFSADGTKLVVLKDDRNHNGHLAVMPLSSTTPQLISVAVSGIADPS